MVSNLINFFFFFSSRRRHTRWTGDWSSDVCSSDLVDHAHPEYSTPECLTPRGLVAHDKAGERILERSLESVERILPPGQRLAIYKNNTDGKGNSYGCHENYLVDRATPFARIVRDLTPFFVTRQVF